MVPKQEERERGDDERHAEAGAFHEDVEENDVHDDRAERHQAQRDKADQQEQAADDLERRHGLQVAGGVHRADEFTGRAGHGRHLHEMQKRIRTKDDEHEPKQDANDDGDDFHVRERAPFRAGTPIVHFDFRYIRREIAGNFERARMKERSDQALPPKVT